MVADTAKCAESASIKERICLGPVDCGTDVLELRCFYEQTTCARDAVSSVDSKMPPPLGIEGKVLHEDGLSSLVQERRQTLDSDNVAVA